jgi:hypothetical protein
LNDMSNGLNKLKINMAELQKDISFIKDSLFKNDNAHKEIIDKLDNFISISQTKFTDRKDHQESMAKVDTIIDTLDSKYSNKWVEKVFIWGGGIIGAAILIGLLTLIAKAYKVL